MLLPFFLSLSEQMKIYHWRCESFAEHKAYDGAYKDLSEIIDEIMEVHMGKYGKEENEKGFYNIKIYDYTSEKNDQSPDNVLKFCIDYVEKDITELFKNDPELLSLKDVLLAHLHKLKYLLTLK